MDRWTHRFNYFKELIVGTPNSGWLIGLSLLAGMFNFIGLPALIPVLDYLQTGQTAAVSNPVIGNIEKIFLQVGVQPGFFSMLMAASALILLGETLVVVSGIVALYSCYSIIEVDSKKVLDLYSKANWRWLLGANSGEMNYVVLKETELAANCRLNAQRLLISGIQCLAYFILAIKISVTSVLLAGVVYGFLIVMNVKNAHVIRRVIDRANAIFKKVSGLLVGLQQNKKFLKTALLNQRVIGGINERLAQIFHMHRHVGVRTQLQYLWSFATMFTFLILLIVFYRPLGFEYSSLLVLILIFNRLAPQFNAFSATYAAVNNYLPMHKALTQRMDEMEASAESWGAQPFDAARSIKFDAVHFAYDTTPVLTDVTIEIKPKTTTAIIGRSGSGKTTILDLMLGLLRPTKGNIYYGDVPCEALDLNSLRSRIAYISQQATMLDGTLKDNLTIGRPDASEEEIKEVCRKAHIDGFVASLPEGLNTLIGENGAKLSGGQKQRIVLARALLLKPSILILDEATSELDLETEKIVHETIRELSRELTIIIVAHRLSAVRQADHIYVLENGQVCESGSYQQLLDMKGKLHFFDSLQK
jgi:ATP-binding cassette, subfamily C, bacterial